MTAGSKKGQLHPPAIGAPNIFASSCRRLLSYSGSYIMHLSCKLALLLIPLNILGVAIVQLENLYHGSPDRINRYLPNSTLLVIAHPDDETMFFGPLALSLLDSGKRLHILCLSRGNSDRLGRHRERELTNVVRALGPNASLSIVDDEEHLRDGMDVRWSSSVIAAHVIEYLKNVNQTATPIHNLVSFDSYGVSGHQNHIDIHQALVSMRHNRPDLNLKHFYLNSISIFRKYISFMDSVIVHPPCLLSANFLGTKRPDDDQLVVALDYTQNKRLRQLLNLHSSQMVWFRKLYQLFSRYMFINDLSE